MRVRGGNEFMISPSLPKGSHELYSRQKGTGALGEIDEACVTT